MGNEAINIEGSSQRSVSISGTAAQTPPLDTGIYDVYSDVDMAIKVDEVVSDVTLANGYKVFAGSVIPVNVDGGRRIGAIAGGAGTMYYHKVG